MLNLGLGALVKKEEPAQVLSYEYLDTVMMYNEACEELTIVCDQFDQVCTAYENLIAISDVIKEHGVTPALEALVGENFPGGLTVEASMEAAEGAMGKIKEFLVRVWEAIKNFFLRFFQGSNGLRARLQKFVKLAEEAGADKVSCNEFKGVKFDFIDKLAVTPAELDAAAGEFMAGKSAEDIEGELSPKGSEAINYAKKLSVALGQMENNKDKFVAICDQMVKTVRTTDLTPEESANASKEPGGLVSAAAEKAKKKAQAAKKIVDLAFKGLHRSAAGFLSHAKIEGGKKDDAKTAENAEAGKEGEGK